PMSRVARLVDAAKSCLDGGHDRVVQTTLAEALLREIDANFTADALPEVLAEQRARLVAMISAPA
ncbi:MAG: hypothetical protein ABL859_09955, partial [Methylotenera sp.]